MRYTVRPLSDHTWLRPAGARQTSRFDSTWSSTLTLLGTEIDQLDGRNVVLEVDVPERGIRNDGMLRADAKAASPAVVVAFDGRHGPMQYRCDRFTEPNWRRGVDWQQNVRAIALTLQALRAVDRYGATDTGQQYAGFKAIGGGTATPMPASHMTTDHARAMVLALAGASTWPIDHREVTRLTKAARRAAHPDHNGGDHTEAYELDEALRLLGLA